MKNKTPRPLLVIPANAGIQYLVIFPSATAWMPVFTGMTHFISRD
jgi:hypothetical protein